MASEDVLLADSVILPDLIRAIRPSLPAIPHSSWANEIGWVDLRCPKFGRVLEVFGLARAPAV